MKESSRRDILRIQKEHIRLECVAADSRAFPGPHSLLAQPVSQAESSHTVLRAGRRLQKVVDMPPLKLSTIYW